MGHGIRRWLAGAGAAAAVGATVLGAGTAGAASAAQASSRLAVTQVSPAVLASRLIPGSVYVPTGAILIPGDHGPAVRALQQRLSFLHYYPGKVDGHFGTSTLEAVWAFKEVQGIGTKTNPNVVGRVFQRKLVNPRLPKVLKPSLGSSRIEVNKNIEVLVLYKNNKVELISHVSTGGNCLSGQGCGWNTPIGSFRARRFVGGWVPVPLGEMYNPVFFIGGLFAIHGDIPVPLYPASHGCVRIPMDVAAFFHDRIHVSETNGTPIYIWGHIYYG
jgi:putative peptidoglycan binding protein/L,D-transpeptidase-like protein